MNFEVVITGNSFATNSLIFLLNTHFNINIANIVPEISMIRDIKLFMPAATLKNLSIPLKKLSDKNVASFNKIHLFLYNNQRILSHNKKIIVSTSLEKLKKILLSLSPKPKNIKIFQNSINEIFYNNDKFYIKLSNNKILTTHYLIIGDDFWGNSWNFINYKPHHTGGWIVKIPNTKSISTIPFIALGYSKKSLILSDNQNLIFSKHIDKEYSIENLIINFLTNNQIIKNIILSDWNKYVLPFSTKEQNFPEHLKNKKIFIITEYLGLTSCLLPDFTYLTSFLVKEFIVNIDKTVNSFKDFIPYINKAIQYNQIFLKINNLINNFPLMFFNNSEKDEILVDLLLGNITPSEADRMFKQIFEFYDRRFEVVLSARAQEEE
ncbi:MAG: hypothetical protein ABDH21_01405 [bacterium]